MSSDTTNYRFSRRNDTNKVKRNGFLLYSDAIRGTFRLGRISISKVTLTTIHLIVGCTVFTCILYDICSICMTNNFVIVNLTKIDIEYNYLRLLVYRVY